MLNKLKWLCGFRLTYGGVLSPSLPASTLPFLLSLTSLRAKRWVGKKFWRCRRGMA